MNRILGWFWWLTIEGQKFLWVTERGDDPDDDYRFWRLRRAWCRFRGHPAGPVYYNPNGYEPDWTCRECGDNLG